MCSFKFLVGKLQIKINGVPIEFEDNIDVFLE